MTQQPIVEEKIVDLSVSVVDNREEGEYFLIIKFEPPNV